MTITSFSPASASPGQVVRILGTLFSGITSVKFGGVEAAEFNVIDSGTIDAIVDAGSASGNVQVVGALSTQNLAGFTFVPAVAPTITSFSPVAAVPGDKVTIKGTGFLGVNSVKFGGVDALFFQILSDTVIEAHPDFTGSNIISVINSAGTTSTNGFNLLLNRVRLIDLPDLGRDPDKTTDLQYYWDINAGKLCKGPVQDVTGGGGGGGGGNVYTALGSPFKVRMGDPSYSYDADTNSVTITDIRLVGKDDYVVSATDVSNEFENTRLSFDQTAGSVTISNYQLTNGSHITVYADGVVNTAFKDAVNALYAEMDILKKVAAPFLPSLNSEGVMTNPGGLVAWFRPAIEIPDGWAEWLPGRGKNLIGQDPSDVYDPDTNPDALGRPNGTAGGGENGAVLTEANIPKIQLYISNNGNMGGYAETNPNASICWTSHHNQGNQDYDFRWSDGAANIGRTSAFGRTSPDPIEVPLNPYRIVNFIYSTQTTSI